MIAELCFVNYNASENRVKYRINGTKMNWQEPANVLLAMPLDMET